MRFGIDKCVGGRGDLAMCRGKGSECEGITIPKCRISKITIRM